MSVHAPYSPLEFENLILLDSFRSRAPVQWYGEYDEAFAKFKRLVNGRVKESTMQDFSERHPYMLPGVDDLHLGPFEGVVTTKFQLGNLFETDFAFVTSNSQTLFVTCVEIESPRKSLFRRDGSLSRDYLDAKQQVIDWLVWAQNNVGQVLDCWRPLLRREHKRRLEVRFQGYLVIGRRKQIRGQKEQDRWSGEAMATPSNLMMMTYDRLLEWREERFLQLDNEKLVVCSYRDRRFYVKHVCS